MDSDEQRADMQREIRSLLDHARIRAAMEILVRRHNQPTHEIIHAASRQADIVFLGIRAPEAGAEAAYASHLGDLVADLPNVLLVRSASQHAGLL